MNINTVKLIYFSPTKTTKKIVEGIAEGLEVDTVERLDLTPPEARLWEPEEFRDTLTIVGTPVYSGRVPLDAIQRLQKLKAIDTLAIIVVLYGNRNYEDALLELKNLVMGAGFTPIAGGAFIGEHSYSNETTPIANGRPDSEDLKKAREFGKMVREKIRGIVTIKEIKALPVPGGFPYRERKIKSKISPITQEPICTKCKQCITVCPKSAMTAEKTIITDQNVCILCCACVKNCPTGARVVDNPQIMQAAKKLSVNCRKRKEPEIYI
jgi:ferredoxin